MEFHQMAFIQAVAFACVVSLGMAGCDSSRDGARALLSDPDVKSTDIAVVTRKGEVQLSGYVNNQTQIDRAIDVARGVEGVQSVGNEMSIKK